MQRYKLFRTSKGNGFGAIVVLEEPQCLVRTADKQPESITVQQSFTTFEIVLTPAQTRNASGKWSL